MAALYNIYSGATAAFEFRAVVRETRDLSCGFYQYNSLGLISSYSSQGGSWDKAVMLDPSDLTIYDTEWMAVERWYGGAYQAMLPSGERMA